MSEGEGERTKRSIIRVAWVHWRREAHKNKAGTQSMTEPFISLNMNIITPARIKPLKGPNTYIPSESNVTHFDV